MSHRTNGVIVIDTNREHFSLIVEHGVVVDAPPVAYYTLGWSAPKAWHHFEGRAQVTSIFDLDLGKP